MDVYSPNIVRIGFDSSPYVKISQTMVSRGFPFRIVFVWGCSNETGRFFFPGGVIHLKLKFLTFGLLISHMGSDLALKLSSAVCLLMPLLWQSPCRPAHTKRQRSTLLLAEVFACAFLWKVMKRHVGDACFCGSTQKGISAHWQRHSSHLFTNRP